MYNRYIPQADGTFARRRIAEPTPQDPPHSPPEAPRPCNKAPCAEPKSKPKCNQEIGSFFSQLLPKGFDTGDLIVVLLLLLMAADSCDDQNTALLTLALYLFL